MVFPIYSYHTLICGLRNFFRNSDDDAIAGPGIEEKGGLKEESDN